jgi:hypothetical protein
MTEYQKAKYILVLIVVSRCISVLILAKWDELAPKVVYRCKSHPNQSDLMDETSMK